MLSQEDALTLLDREILSNDDVLMVPKLGRLSSRKDAEIAPYIYSSPMDTVTGYELTKSMVENGQHPVVCRFLKEEWFRCLVEYHDNPDVFFAIGSRKEQIKYFLDCLYKIRPKVKDFPPVSVAVDIAHGDTVDAHALYTWLSEQPFIGRIMSGSVCTADAAVRVFNSGCSHVRVGIGPGSACTTRLMTGCGMPQLSAVYFAYKALESAFPGKEYHIIADGGVRSPGDANKYLAAGATGIMMGREFSTTTESAGWETIQDPETTSYSGVVSFPLERPKTIKVKKYRGQASASFQKDMFGSSNVCPEGASTGSIYPTTSCKAVLDKYKGGLASAISYLGLRSSLELCPETVEFVKVTSSGHKEGTPHGC